MSSFSAFDYSQIERAPTDPERLPKALVPYLRDLEAMTQEELVLLRWRLYWKKIARQKQLPPKEFEEFQKTIWGIRSGRGFGKTLTAANWLGARVATTPELGFAMAPTHGDVYHTCFAGPTGLLAVIPKELIKESNKTPMIELQNGSMIRGFAGDSPERMRGPQHHCGWMDEIASFRYPDEAWSNAWFGLRLGAHPQLVWTGTPKPTAFMRSLVKEPRSVITIGTTYENRENLTPTFYENVAKYEGTKIGRQELLGEILDPEEEGIVKRSQWKLWPNDKPLPKFQLIIMSLDTAFTEATHDKKRQANDPSACSVWGVFTHNRDEKHVILLDCWEEWYGFTDLVKRVRREKRLTYGDADEPLLRPRAVRDPPRHQGKSVDIIIIEEKGSGISLRQQLAKEGVLTHGYNPGRADKLSRLHAVSPMFAWRRVWAVESDKNPGQPRNWADPLITQVCSYVGEGSIEHDDLLDTTTQAMRFIMDKYIESFSIKQDPEEQRRLAEKAKVEESRRKKGNPYGG